MADEDTAHGRDAAAEMLIAHAEALSGLAIGDDERPGVTAHLVNTLRIAGQIGDGPTENGPVFSCRPQ